MIFDISPTPASLCSSCLLIPKVESTNIAHVVTVRYNLATRSAYSGDWGWVLGRVDPSLTVEDANSLSAADANELYDERCPIRCVKFLVSLSISFQQ